MIQDSPKVYSINLIPINFFFFCPQIRSFQLEDSQDCSRDFVEIREGNATGHLVGRYCGHTLPLNYSSILGHSLWVRFVSDGSGSGTGFQATFAKSKSVLFQRGLPEYVLQRRKDNFFSNPLSKNNPKLYTILLHCLCGIALLYNILETLNYLSVAH